MRRDAKVDAAPLLEATARWARDPLGFVTQTLKAVPDAWQHDVLQEIGGGLATSDEAIRIAVASGHGVGKSALVAWILLWAMATHQDTRGVVTANTETQLRTKTWAELAKWLRAWEYREWFDFTSMALASRVVGHGQTWRLDLVPWSETNAEAFAGLHNHGKRTIVVFDEASAIPDVIWDTTEGALTDKETELLWLVFGNPTRNTGRFRECFARFAHRWRGRQVDSRTVKITNKAQLQRWVDDYGEDSDFVRVRVRGVFPRAGSMQFIDSESVEEAMRRETVTQPDDPTVVGVDVARFGDDRSVIFARKGSDGRSRPPLVLRGVDTMTLSGRVVEVAAHYRADAVFVDEGGVGGGVVDRLRQLGVPHVIGVNFAGKADRWTAEGGGPLFANKRAEIWGWMKEWLKTGAIPDDPALAQDLTGVEYGYDARNAIQLERKDDMKKRGLASPDLGDALALTFAQPVHPLWQRNEADRKPRILDENHDYDMFHDL
ncbi:MAG: terminase [Reyranella sp.]|nr:terminase [Reyranella sp.]